MRYSCTGNSKGRQFSKPPPKKKTVGLACSDNIDRSDPQILKIVRAKLEPYFQIHQFKLVMTPESDPFVVDVLVWVDPPILKPLLTYLYMCRKFSVRG